MPSNGIYPPEIENGVPVFQVFEYEDTNTDKTIRIKYGGDYEVKYYVSEFGNNEHNVIQCSISYQKGGASAINKEDDEARGRYRQTNSIILPLTETRQTDGNFIISHADLFNYTWEIGTLYKIQMRIGNITNKEELNEENIKENQSLWLTNHNRDFSEWSTVAIIKPIEQIEIDIPVLEYNSLLKLEQDNIGNKEEQYQYYGTILDFYGTYRLRSGNYIENLYSYQVQLRDIAKDLIVEDSGIIYATELNKFHYLFHHELESEKSYEVLFNYTTENGFTLKDDEIITISLKCNYNKGYGTLKDNLFLITPDILDDPIDGKPRRDILKSMLGNTPFPFDTFTVDNDNEEGRISIKLCNKVHGESYSGNLILVRSDNRSNYTYWEDIKIINIVQQDLNTLDIIYDYTVESGVIYSYAIQEVILVNKQGDYNRTGSYSKIQYDGIRGNNSPIIREFEHSFLLGENGQQLKLKFNNSMDSFKININTTKVDTIGSQYPFVMKNGNMKYKSFPIKGLISFHMDDSDLFSTPYDTYNYKATFPFQGENAKNDIVDQYKWYNSIHYGYGERVYVDNNNNEVLDIIMDSKYMQYDTIYEKLFRDRVLDFLHDGKPKLFKSATEGNIIVQLMDINLSPHQELNRMLYSFSANAIEIDDSTLPKYLEYKFYNIGKIITDFSVKEIKIGQIKGNFYLQDGNIEGDNIIDAIVKKYDLRHINMAGYSIAIDEIFDIQIEFNSKPYPIGKDKLLMGYEMELQLANDNTIINTPIKVLNPSGVYVFDELVKIDVSKTSHNNVLKIKASDNKSFEHDTKDIFNTKRKTINITVNFLYTMVRKPFEEKYLNNIVAYRVIGQLYQNVSKGTSLTNIIKNKYAFNYHYMETKDDIQLKHEKIRKILQFQGINLEANPGLQFAIYDKNEFTKQIFTIGKTGNLNISSVFDIDKIVYEGPDESADVLLDYYYVLEEGDWRKDD